ncbi:ABC transporter permease [Botrimarina sp.]|uniref:ABC transporter permease n=1 Tax=Botrimarina sp. TaxID=2795802 RepID=UPI0032EC0CA6
MQTATAEPMIAATRPDTWRLARRFFWKERRRLTGLAIAVAVGAVLLMLAHAALALPSAPPGVRLVVAFGAACLMAVAAAVTVFAVEHEENTVTLLRTLPRNRAALVVGKLAAAAAVTLVLLAALVAVATLLDRGAVAPRGGAIAGQGFVFLAEALVFGLLSSLLVRQPLLAAVLGIGAASVASQLAIFAWAPSAHGFTLQDFQAATPVRLAIVALVGVIDVGLGLRWLDSGTAAMPSWRPRATAKPTTTDSPKRRPWRSTFGRLCWQTWRQSWRTMLAALVLGPFLTASTALIVGFSGVWSQTASMLTALSLGFTPALYGALVFRADQRGESYRFLAEHAGRPRTTWLARQVVWLTPLVLFGALVTAGVLIWGVYVEFDVGRLWYGNIYTMNNSAQGLWASIVDQTRTGLHATAVLWLTGLLAYAVGQLASIAMRSDVLAGLVALVASVGVMAWGLVTGFWLLPPGWFIGPIAALLLAAGWLRSRDWMFERSSWKNWLAPAALVVAPTAIVVCSVPSARLAQLDDPVLLRHGYAGSFFPNEGGDIFTLAEEARERRERGKEVADAYRRLLSEYLAARHPGSGGEFGIRATQPASEGLEGKRLDAWFGEVIELSKVDCRLPRDVFGASSFRGVSGSLIMVLLDGVADSDASDNADAMPALARLGAAWRIDAQQPLPLGSVTWRGDWLLGKATVDWAQSAVSEQILKLIQEIRAIKRANVGEGVARVMDAYLQAEEVLRGDSPPVFLAREDRTATPLRWLAYSSLSAPGERERAGRALAVITSAQIDWLAAMDVFAVSERVAGPRTQPWWEPTATALVMATQEYEFLAGNATKGIRRAPTSERIEWLRHARSSAAVSHDVAGTIENRTLAQLFHEQLAYAARRRVELVRLALIACHRREGVYPESLDALAPKYLPQDELFDPFNHELLGYDPDGFEHEVFNFQATERLAGKNVGLVWSRGLHPVEPQTVELRVAYDQEGKPQGKVKEGLDFEERGWTTEMRTVTLLIDSTNWYGVSDGFVRRLPRLDRSGIDAPTGSDTTNALDPQP